MTAAEIAASRERSGAIPSASRVAWVDIAKGWCIILVVMMHSALGVGLVLEETGWLHAIVAFAKPFRMPDFFLIAGLFVGRAVERPWRTYLDRKVVHFVYFYALWVLIVLLLKAGPLGLMAPWPFLTAYLWSFVEPFSSMWFIYILPFLFLTARFVRALPRAAVVFATLFLHLAAASFPDRNMYVMESMMTGSILVNSYSLFLFFFLVGHFERDRIFRFAATAGRHPMAAIAGFGAWALFNQLGVSFGLAAIPGLTVIYGIGGALAVVAGSSLLARARWMRWLAYCGRHSLTIYLAFVVPMGAARVLLIQFGMISNVGWLSLVVTVVAIIAPLILNAVTRDTPLAFLFRRPSWAGFQPRVLGK